MERILQALRLELDKQGLIELTTWHIDATMIKAHKAAAGAGKKVAPRHWEDAEAVTAVNST